MKLVFGIPKGSLQESTIALFRKAGWNIRANSRSYYPGVNDPELELILIRAQEISRYVEQGVLDAGLTGLDWIKENRSTVVEVGELLYAKSGSNAVRWVLAVPENSPIKSAKDLQGKRIATELVQATRDWLAAQGVTAEVEFSWGATEVKAPKLVDAIVELTETGSSLKANQLRIVEVLFESKTKLIANPKSWMDPAKKAKLENMHLLLQGALNAELRAGLKMNVPCAKLKEIMALLPALQKPTVSPLYETDWVAVEIIVEEVTARELIPKLKRAGAQGILEYPLSKLIF